MLIPPSVYISVSTVKYGDMVSFDKNDDSSLSAAFLKDKPENKNIEHSLYTLRRPSFVSQGHYEIDRAPFKL